MRRSKFPEEKGGAHNEEPRGRSVPEPLRRISDTQDFCRLFPRHPSITIGVINFIICEAMYHQSDVDS